MKLIDHDYLDKLQGFTAEQKSQLLINAVKCLGILKFQPAKDRILALSQGDPDLAVRDASLEALKKLFITGSWAKAPCATSYLLTGDSNE